MDNNCSSCVCIFSRRQSSLKSPCRSLAEQLAVWLASEGKASFCFVLMCRYFYLRHPAPASRPQSSIHAELLNSYYSCGKSKWGLGVVSEFMLPPHWCRFHPEGPGVCPIWGGAAHQRGHLPLPRAAVLRLVRGGLPADWPTGSHQASPQDDPGQEQSCESYQCCSVRAVRKRQNIILKCCFYHCR